MVNILAKKIEKYALTNWLASLASDGKLFGPIKNSGGWGRIEAVHNIGDAFDEKMSCKEIYLPREQTMFILDAKKPFETMQTVLPSFPDGSVLWGIHPCDARALDLIRRVFNEGKYRDIFFNTAWDGIIRIAVGCTEPQPSCFCTSLAGGSPFGTQGVDILATEIGESWIMENITSRGEALIREMPDAEESDLEKLAGIKREATGKVDSSIPTDIADNMLELFDDESIWENLGETCIGCGTCTSVCPGCYCFDIEDELNGEEVRRYRKWDSCIHKSFTMHESGYNPRATQKQRIRQRIFHKLSFFAIRYDETQLCVGCGRCVNRCPQGIDIRDIAKKVFAKTVSDEEKQP